MTPLDVAQMHAELAHAVKLILESLCGAGFLTCCYLYTRFSK